MRYAVVAQQRTRFPIRVLSGAGGIRLGLPSARGSPTRRHEASGHGTFQHLLIDRFLDVQTRTARHRVQVGPDRGIRTGPGTGLTVQVPSPFKDVKDLIAKANGSRYGLAAGVWSGDGRKAQIVARALQVETVWINSYHTIDPHMPFGGWRQSGWGREFGRMGVESYTEVKSIAMKL